ncbi:MAG: hypothetical protein KKC30_01175 [Proteobacteria bacterium]|nr:hypothetical protein [Pseudomonadota bacterium]MBU4382608.1 hypothetical protein [Pseudomonadota bacterium]MCG2765124.1 hypothetical protein [Desulfarculaceae bacterium]
MPNHVRNKAFWPWAGLLVALNLATRLPWLLKADKFMDADHALWGLMARHIAQGLHFPYYMYGQGYMGAGETYYLAPFFALLGSSPKVMAWAMTGLLMLVLVLNAVLIRRLAGRGPALATLLLAALAPPFFFRLGLLSYGGYTAVLLWGVLLWLVWTRVYLARPPDLGRRGWRLALLALVAALGWWTWTMFWLMVIPCLAYHGAFLAGHARRGLGPSRYGGRAPWWDPAAKTLAALSLAYLAYALAVLALGRDFSWQVLPGLAISSDPTLALYQDLPLALCALALAEVLYFWPRLEGWALGRLGQEGRAHLWGLAAFGAGFLAKQGGDTLFQHSDIAAWGRYVLPVLPATPGRIWANLELLAGSAVPQAWSPHPPLQWTWLAWLLFAAGLAACLGVAASLIRAARQRSLAQALAQDWMAYACALSYLGLLAALTFTTAMVDRFSVRYLWVSIVWWPFLLAWGVAALARRTRWQGVLAGAMLLVALGGGIVGVAAHPAAGHSVSWREHYGPLLRYMGQHGVRHGRADYWEAYKLSFLSGEELIFAPDKRFPVGLQRYDPYYWEVLRAPRKLYLFRPQVDDAALAKVRHDLRRKGVPFEERDLGRWRVILTGPASSGGASRANPPATPK